MLGLWGATALVTGGMVGAGILVLPSMMAMFGTWSIVGWVLTAFMAYSIATIFGRLSKHFKGGAGPIHYIADTFGAQYGYLVAWGYATALCFSGSLIATALGNYALPLIGCSVDCVPAWTIGYGFIVLLFLLNMASAGSANALLVVLTALKVVFFIDIAFFGCMNFRNYVVHFGPVTDVLQSASMAMFAFLGIEFAATASSSIKNPEKNVMLATKLGLLFSTIAFIGVHCAVLFTLPDASASSKPVYDTAAILFGSYPWLATAFGLIAVISCISTLNGVVVVQGNNMKNMADKAWLPKVLATKTKQGFPWKGAFVFCIAAFLIMFSNMFDKKTMITMANSLVAIMYLVSCLVDIKKMGWDIYNIMALVSAFLILYNVNALMLGMMIGVYVVGYIVKIISNKIYSRRKR